MIRAFILSGPYHEPEFITIIITDPITAYDENAKPYTTYELQTEVRGSSRSTVCALALTCSSDDLSTIQKTHQLCAQEIS